MNQVVALCTFDRVPRDGKSAVFFLIDRYILGTREKTLVADADTANNRVLQEFARIKVVVLDQVVHGEKSPAGVSGDIRQRASLGAGHEGDRVRSNCKALRTIARYAETEINGERRIGINRERRSVLRPLS